jgi:hypothetical protein
MFGLLAIGDWVIGQLDKFTINDESHARQIGKNCDQCLNVTYCSLMP